jgi:hypothetical protein
MKRKKLYNIFGFTLVIGSILLTSIYLSMCEDIIRYNILNDKSICPCGPDISDPVPPPILVFIIYIKAFIIGVFLISKNNEKS